MIYLEWLVASFNRKQHQEALDRYRTGRRRHLIRPSGEADRLLVLDFGVPKDLVLQFLLSQNTSRLILG